MHADAQAARKNALIGLTRIMPAAASSSLSPKDLLIYRGIFFLANSQLAQAREALSSALTMFGTGEIGDTRLKMYLSMVTSAAASMPVAAAPAVPAALVAPVPTQPAIRHKVRKPAAEKVVAQTHWMSEEEIKVRQADASRLYTVGLVFYGQGKKEEAVSSWKQAVSLDPDNKYAARALKHAEQELREGSQ